MDIAVNFGSQISDLSFWCQFMSTCGFNLKNNQTHWAGFRCILLHFFTGGFFFLHQYFTTTVTNKYVAMPWTTAVWDGCCRKKFKHLDERWTWQQHYDLRFMEWPRWNYTKWGSYTDSDGDVKFINTRTEIPFARDM